MSGIFVVAAMSLLSADPILFETETFRYALTAEGRSNAFVDKSTGTDYCDVGSDQPFATWIDTSAHPATGALLQGNLLTVRFSAAEREAVFRVETHAQRLVFELVALHGDIDLLRELQFAAIPLTLSGMREDTFAVSPLALTLETLCDEIPGFTSTLTGVRCFRALGMEGSAVAIIACPPDRLRDALKEALGAAPALAHSSNGGPWALDSGINRQSYMVDFAGTVTEESVGSWIAMLNGIGVKQLDLHGGHAFRFGYYAPNPEVFPEGRASLKRVVDALHDAGIAAGLHTYAMFIAKDTPWVTPLPHSGLAKDRAFTLAADVDAAAAMIPVSEDTGAISAVTGFHVRNSATLQIDDELMIFTGVSSEPPFGFTACHRGAYGTTPASHSAGARVHKLKECFGLFAPDPESSLYEEVISATARTYNECGFDMMYMDALDGSDVIDLKGGGQFGWYYAAKFTHDLVRHLERAPVLEMSTFSHHLWSLRSRMGAWDVCQRAPQTFVDIHQLSNSEWRDHFLPTNLGWWAIFPWSGVQPRRTLPDDLEYVCAKALGTDSSLSLLLGFAPDTYVTSENQQRMGEILRRYESLRLSNTVPQSVRDQLATPGQAFRLQETANGVPRFEPVAHLRHDVRGSADEWMVENPYPAQLPRILIEAQLSLQSFDAPESVVIEDFSDIGAYDPVTAREGVSASISLAESPTMNAATSAVLTARNTGAERNRSWAHTRRIFDPPISLQGRGLGLWVHGDGKGALLNVQLRSPIHVSPALSEHYVRLGFTGWRYVELVESEDYTIEKYEWPYSRPRSDWGGQVAGLTSFAYPVYHAHLDYGQVGELHLALNDVPQGEEVQVFLGPVRSIPHQRVALGQPRVSVNDDVVFFPVEIQSGQLLEILPPRTYVLRDEQGAELERGVLQSDLPPLRSGVNRIGFECEPPADAGVRARITITTAGEPLEP